MQGLLGQELIRNDGSKVSVAELERNSQAVALMFSASWCPPCRQFLASVLLGAYPALHKKGLELVFISSDQDERSMMEYFKKMPWLALDFNDRERKAKLSSKYKVTGIPTIVIVDAKTGEMITDQGRAKIGGDPTGENFPWRPTNVLDDFKKMKFVTPADATVQGIPQIEKLEAIGVLIGIGKVVQFQRFAAMLADRYEKINAAQKRFEVVYVAFDDDESEFNQAKKSYPAVPWLTLPYPDRAAARSLAERYDIEGVPTLIIVDAKTGKVINEEAVLSVVRDEESTKFPWGKEPVMVLDGVSAGDITKRDSVLIFCGDDDAKAQALVEKLSLAVKTWTGAAPACDKDGVCVIGGERVEGAEDLNFYVAGTHPVAGKVKALMGKNATNEEVTLAVFDLQTGKYFPATKAKNNVGGLGDVNVHTLRDFVKAFLKKEVEGKPLVPPEKAGADDDDE